MPSLKELRGRIESVKATQKITKAMQLVAVARLNKVRDAAESARPYSERMEGVIRNLGWRVADMAEPSPLLVGTGSEQRLLCIVATTERGLCGGLNANIVKYVKQHLDHFIKHGRDVHVICVGRKGYTMLRREYGSRIVDTVSLRDVKRIAYGQAHDIAENVLTRFRANEFDVCCIFYAHFASVLTQEPTSIQLIPAVFSEAMTLEDMNEANERTAGLEFESDEQEVLNDLLPRNVAVQIFRALLENAASEQGARMTAMESATRNAGELIDKLTLQYNRTRQAQITRELMEIIAGAEALD
ncbi:MAG: F0F1 ATP synthase subunit gamma [Hyphomicrobiales bacterium]|nr:F0F1 ATP synthase subunit gamma [Hyphomicrobiales bacterium]